MSFGWVHKTAAAALIIAAWNAPPARAQFEPGRIFTVDVSSFTCKDKLDGEYVLEIDPEAGTTRVFAQFLDCPGLRSMAMSPDGKHLRVATEHWGAILEFDSEANWEIVIDGSDGVVPRANYNSITYDLEGNFYLSNYYLFNEKVFRFPADGGPKQVLAYADNNGVTVRSPYSLSAGPSGELYVADENELILISAHGVVSLFDTIDESALSEFIYSILVDDAGFVHAQTGGIWYRYELGNPSSREVLAQCSSTFQGLCGSQGIELSPDRTRIYTGDFDYSRGLYDLVSVDPKSGASEIVLGGGGERNFAVVPLRGDVDGDRDTDVEDLESLTDCLAGPGTAMDLDCDLADMDADGDVDLFDARYFTLGYAAFAETGD